MVVPSTVRRCSRGGNRLQRMQSFYSNLLSAYAYALQFNGGEWLLPAWSVILFTIISALIAIRIGFGTSRIRKCELVVS